MAGQTKRPTNYVPGIDGLRAIAVVGVVIYHLLPSVLPGGFVGVDVFFVISGYLITGIILREILENRFSFKEFYKRRAIRILPPLIAMLVAVILGGWFYLTPEEFKTLGRHALAGLLFLSNFQLLSEAGYFDTASTLKPLLHLWSLGIEEQFYILWPVLLIAVFRTKVSPSLRLPILGFVTFGSLTFCLFTTPIDPSKAFYHPLSRIWEMGAGAILQVLLMTTDSRTRLQHIPSALKRIIGPLGALLVLLSYFVLKTTSPFPGWRALLPVVGSLLILLSLQFPIRNYLLEHKAVVGVGKVSYSLYLWHWPPIALGHILYGKDLPPSYLMATLLLGVLASLVSYFFVETPIRFGRLVPRFGVFKVIGVPSVVLLTLATLLTTNTWTPRAHHEFFNEAQAARDDWSFPGNLPEVEISTGRVFATKLQFDTLVVGDSNAQQYAPRFLHLDKSGGYSAGVAFLTRSSCPPLPNLKRTLTKQCDSFFASLRATIDANPQVRRVILAAQWAGYLWSDEYVRDDGKPSIESLNELRLFIKELHERNIQVGVILNIPVDERLMPDRIFQRSVGGQFTLSPPVVELTSIKNLERTTALILSTLADSPARLVNPLESLCPGGQCRSVDLSDRPIYKDCCHLRAQYTQEQADWVDRLFAD